jgi:hypothetical protein
MALRRASSVALGSAYERAVIGLLAEHGCTQLTGTGGAGDRGLDFVGEWCLSERGLSAGARPRHSIRLLLALPADLRLPVAGQCKATGAPVGTATLRDFQAALAGSAPNVLAVLACTSGFALREIAAQPLLLVRHTLLLHVRSDAALLGAVLLTARTGEASRADAPPLMIQSAR